MEQTTRETKKNNVENGTTDGTDPKSCTGIVTNVDMQVDCQGGDKAQTGKDEPKSTPGRGDELSVNPITQAQESVGVPVEDKE